MADIIARAKMMGDMYDDRVPPLDMKGWAATGLKRSQLGQLMQETENEFEKAKAFLAIVRKDMA